MSDNRNEIERYVIPAAQLDALFARSNAQALADREARRRAAEWQGEVESLLGTMARQIGTLNQRMAAMERKP